MTEPTSRWGVERIDGRGADYDTKWEALAAAGASVHGEADFVAAFAPRGVLDAGCGTGRVAIELASRGIDVVGIDLDGAMLDQARAKAPELAWLRGSVRDASVGRSFDLVLTAGNVMIFVEPGTETEVVRNLAGHLVPGGLLVSGFQLDHAYDLDRYDADCGAAGLDLVARHATWDGEPWTTADDYAVSVHRNARPARPSRPAPTDPRRAVLGPSPHPTNP